MKMSHRKFMKRADKWATFSLHAVLLFACGGCGSSGAGPASDVGADAATDSGRTVEGGTGADATGVLDATSRSSDAGAPNGAVDAGTCSGGMCSPVVLFGGSNGGYLNDTWTFNGMSWTQVPVRPSPSVRLGAAMATLGNEVVMFGGGEAVSAPPSPSPVLDETWTFNGTSWTQVSVSNPPPERDYAAMATLDNEVVLFGGRPCMSGQPGCSNVATSPNPADLNDTWTFNGTSWTQISVSQPPPAREQAAMATLGNEVVLFGGANIVSELSDTWTFDGTNWTQVPVSNPPPARAQAMMATLGNEVVLFGGTGSSGALLSDIWKFDGTSWNQVLVSNPLPARRSATTATVGNEVVLFGGANNTNLLNDTWTFDGTSWTQVSVSNPPPARDEAAMATLP